MLCLACPGFVSSMGCDLSVVRATESRAGAGAVLGCILDGAGSKQ